MPVVHAQAMDTTTTAHAAIASNELLTLQLIQKSLTGVVQAEASDARGASMAPVADVTTHASSSLSRRGLGFDPRCCSDVLSHFVPLLESFSWTGHAGRPLSCLVLGRLGSSLQQLLQLQQKTDSRAEASSALVGCHRGLPLSSVKNMTKQVLHALEHLNSLGLVHCDVKPGNIMTHWRRPKASGSSPGSSLPYGGGSATATAAPAAMDALSVSLRNARWSLIDFGLTRRGSQSSSWSSKRGEGISNTGSCSGPTGDSCRLTEDPSQDLYRTISYSPPEAVLCLLPGGPPSPGYDIWSLACVTYEAATGSKLFDVPQSMAWAEGRMSSLVARGMQRPWWATLLPAAWVAETRGGEQSCQPAGRMDGRLGIKGEALYSDTATDPADDAEDEMYLQLVEGLIGPAPEEFLHTPKDQGLMRRARRHALQPLPGGGGRYADSKPQLWPASQPLWLSLGSLLPPARLTQEAAATSCSLDPANSTGGSIEQAGHERQLAHARLLHRIQQDACDINVDEGYAANSSTLSIPRAWHVHSPRLKPHYASSPVGGIVVPCTNLPTPWTDRRMLGLQWVGLMSLLMLQAAGLASFLMPLLEWDPMKRPDASELLGHPFLRLEGH